MSSSRQREKMRDGMRQCKVREQAAFTPRALIEAAHVAILYRHEIFSRPISDGLRAANTTFLQET